VAQAFSLRRPDSSGRSPGSAVGLIEILPFQESRDSSRHFFNRRKISL
jgi:hypothetical protein